MRFCATGVLSCAFLSTIELCMGSDPLLCEGGEPRNPFQVSTTHSWNVNDGSFGAAEACLDNARVPGVSAGESCGA